MQLATDLATARQNRLTADVALADAQAAYSEWKREWREAVSAIPMPNSSEFDTSRAEAVLSHIDAFRRLFYGNMLTALERESKKRKLTPNRSDIQDGLFIYNITNMLAPNFDSQSKTRLINEDVASVFKKQTWRIYIFFLRAPIPLTHLSYC